MLDVLLVLILSGGITQPCQHGPVCTEHTLTWDATAEDDEILYWTLYWKMSVQLPDPTAWMFSTDTCLEQPCQINIVDPSQFPRTIVFFSLTATNSAGESDH